jgi:hypothetical protein
VKKSVVDNIGPRGHYSIDHLQTVAGYNVYKTLIFAHSLSEKAAQKLWIGEMLNEEIERVVGGSIDLQIVSFGKILTRF